MRKAKKYTTAYKKKVDVERDMYLQRRSPKGILQCRGCGAVYYRQRWTLAPSSEVRNQAELRTAARAALCPACRKIRDRYPAGELRLVAVPARERSEIRRILKNEEERAREKNPLERIMSLEANDPTGWKVHATTEKLAQRLGRCLHKAHGGTVAYK